jgi:hypothetical protein
MWGTTGSTYANGAANEFHTNDSAWHPCTTVSSGPDDFFFKTFVQSTPITSLTLPSGYDQHCLISYVCNDSSGKFKQYTQKNRNKVMGTGSDWRAFTSITGLVEAVDLNSFLPPVSCSVQFVSYTTIGTPTLDTPIGGVACTDMATVANTYSPGAVIANTRSNDTAITPQIATALHGTLIVEDRVVLTRMHNTNCRLYVTQVTF